MNLPPEALAQALGPAGGGSGSAPGMEAGGAPPGGAPPAPPGGGMDPQSAVQLLQQHGITPDNAPQIAQALMTVQQSMGGGGGGPPPMPPGGMPPGV